jgi:hypothetical protein
MSVLLRYQSEPGAKLSIADSAEILMKMPTKSTHEAGPLPVLNARRVE